MKRRSGERCGSSRSLGPSKQCAIYERGDRRCAWCEAQLIEPRPWGKPADVDCTHYATIDHLDGDRHNNDPSNLVPSCNGCNVSRSDDWEKGDEWEYFEAKIHDWWGFDLYLTRHGADIAEAIERVEAQRWIPLDMKAGRALAERWHAGRLSYSKAWNRQARRRKKLIDHDRLAA